MTIPAISALSSIVPTSTVSPLTGIAASDTTSATSGADFGSSLANAVGKGLGAVQSAQSNADNLAIGAATGNLTDIQDYTIAASEAGQMTDLAVAIRDKGIDAFNQIMGMQA
jgi:flagellar hook-basal body complex protein FliE